MITRAALWVSRSWIACTGFACTSAAAAVASFCAAMPELGGTATVTALFWIWMAQQAQEQQRRGR